MFGSSVLEIAIGVVFIYLVLSLFCSAINEVIATIVNKRGRNLFEGIKNLLNDPSFTGLAQQLYNHGLVGGISKEAVNPGKPNRLPSYMPSKTFSLALLDILGSYGVVAAAHSELLSAAEEADDSYEKARQAAAKKPEDKALAEAVEQTGNAVKQAEEKLKGTEAAAKKLYDQAVELAKSAPNDEQLVADLARKKGELDKTSAAIKILAARRAAIASARNSADAALRIKASNALEEALAAGRKLAAGAPDTISNIQAAVQRLPNGHTRESLLVLIDKSKREISEIQDGVERFRENTEGWFNDAMDRVGGWYKRWTQRIQLSLAIVLVLLLNADTIMLIQRFSSDKDLRTTVLASAQQATTQPIDSLRAKVDLLSLPLGWSIDANDSRHFPWNGVDQHDNEYARKVFGLTLVKLIGLLISIGAVAMGAPFWFDTLSKFVNVRGAGTPPGDLKKGTSKS